MKQMTGTDHTALPKRVYAAPRLTVYGGLRELTLRDGGTKGMNDGGAAKDKTGF